MGMRKLACTQTFLLILLLISIQALFGQTSVIDKGSKMVSGSISLDYLGGKLYEDQNKNKPFVVAVDPAFSYFVFPGLAAGVKVEVSSLYLGNNKIYSSGAGPQLWYFFNSKPTFDTKDFLFINASYIYAKQSRFGEKTMTVDFHDFLIHGKDTCHEFALSVGGNYMLTTSTGIYLEWSYIYKNVVITETDESLNGNTIKLAVGLQTFFF